MGRDPRDSSRERSNQAGERNAATRTPPRGTPPRLGASAPRRAAGRPPSDPRPGRPGNGNGYSNGSNGGNGNGNGGSYRRPVAGGPDDGDSRRSGAYSATGARGPRSVPGYGDSGRSRASIPGGNGDGNGATPPRRRSMADLARDASRSMSRQLSSVVSRTGHAIRRDGPPPQPRGPRTPPPGYPGAMLSAETAKLSPQAYRRSRSRMVARKWRRGRIQRNPVLYFATVLFAFTALLSVVAGGGAGGAYAFSYYQSHYNDILAVTELQSQQNSIIYDRNGTQIAVLKDDNGNLNFYAPLKQISTKVQWATIDTEDRNFYSPFNIGVDFVGTVRAGLSNASGGSTQGGSTITQQLVKNIVIKDSKQTIDRKLHEAILAIGVNNSYTKAQILEFYLNSIYYHPFRYRGIEAAARYYFHLAPKPQSDGSVLLANQQLDWAQAALLAAVPNNAVLYEPDVFSCDKAPCPQSKWNDPYVPGQECSSNFNVNGSLVTWALNNGHEWLTYCRALLVLGNVLQYQGDGVTFTQADFDKSKAELKDMFEKQQIFTFESANSDISQGGGAAINLAPHFVQYVAKIMQNEFGVDHLETAGLRIYTTLDLNLNQYAQQQLQYYLLKPHLNPWYGVGSCGRDAATGILIDCALKDSDNANNGAVVAVDQHTGDILAMVGSVDYNDKDPKVAGAVNVADSLRSMGSATKPLVYATAFQMGWTPSTVLQDVPICFPGFDKVFQAPAPTDPNYDPKAFNPTPGCNGYYTPTNYTNVNFSGRFPLRYNFGNSLNIGATETLAFVGDTAATSSDFLAMVHRLGVTSLDAAHMGPTTALGTQDIKLDELVGAYATLANAGKRAPERAVLRVEDSRGNVLYNAPAVPQAGQAISPQAAYMVTSVLTDNDARTADFGGVKNPLHFEAARGEPSGVAIAAKTGTSSGNGGPPDILTAGYSPFLTVGVWIGNSDGSSMSPDIIGVAGAGYVFHDMMLWADKNYHWPAQAQFPIPPDMTRGVFNCTTGLAPYKDEKPDSLKCTNGQATQGIPLPAGAHPTGLYPDDSGYHENADWYIQGSEPVHS